MPPHPSNARPRGGPPCGACGERAAAAGRGGRAQELFDKIDEMCKAGQIGELMKCDQLAKSREEGKGFVGFLEGAITHQPTFKVKRVAGFEYTTQRSPAFCDHIMWRSLPGLAVTQPALWAAPEVASSDHKPVACTLVINFLLFEVFNEYYLFLFYS